MKILSITTSSQICGVAILDNTSVIKKIELNNGLTHSQNLLPIIQKLLNESNLTLTNIDLIICDIGPGSFTGIRIGIATAKAFADSLNIKTIGVCSLDSLLFNTTTKEFVCALIDAQKDNVYCKIFENRIVKRKASFENIDSLLLELKNKYNNYNLTFVGDGSLNYQEKILQYLPNSQFAENNYLSAINVGLAGFYNLKYGYNSDVTPLYLRKSSAELQLKK